MTRSEHVSWSKVHALSILSAQDAVREMSRIGVSREGIAIMTQKALFRCVKVRAVSPATANILKQEMLAAGGDAAVAYGCIDCSVAQSDVLLMGTLAQYARLTDKLARQYASLQEIGSEIRRILLPEKRPLTWRCRDHTFELTSKTLLMGVLNVTPDSFSDGGAYPDPDSGAARVRQMIAEGADIIDIGGESTRPGSESVTADEECRRVLPVLDRLGDVAVPLSLDTHKSSVAEEGLRRGVSIINDITALRGDPHMPEVVARYRAGLVLMHMQGMPQTMQENPHYEDVIAEISDFLAERVDFARRNGIPEEQIVIDPGIGFGKTLEHNLEIIAHLGGIIEAVGRPLLIGVSRKSFIGKILDLPVTERLEGTLASAAIATWNGASIIRMHDIQAAKRATRIVDALKVSPLKKNIP
jgi:dihydropteroate synthase